MLTTKSSWVFTMLKALVSTLAVLSLCFALEEGEIHKAVLSFPIDEFPEMDSLGLNAAYCNFAWEQHYDNFRNSGFDALQTLYNNLEEGPNGVNLGNYVDGQQFNQFFWNTYLGPVGTGYIGDYEPWGYCRYALAGVHDEGEIVQEHYIFGYGSTSLTGQPVDLHLVFNMGYNLVGEETDPIMKVFLHSTDNIFEDEVFVYPVDVGAPGVYNFVDLSELFSNGIEWPYCKMMYMRIEWLGYHDLFLKDYYMSDEYNWAINRDWSEDEDYFIPNDLIDETWSNIGEAMRAVYNEYPDNLLRWNSGDVSFWKIKSCGMMSAISTDPAYGMPSYIKHDIVNVYKPSYDPPTALKIISVPAYHRSK
ncbi:hypothetical protein ISS30_06605 [bacterium]|nr:hypothetical protein [bacterium]